MIDAIEGAHTTLEEAHPSADRGVPLSGPSVALEALRQRGADLEAQRRASATRKVYAREIAAFGAWTAAQGLSSDPGDPVAVYGYLAHLADHKALATVRKVAACLSSIAKEHGSVSPLKHDRVAALLSGLRRETAARGIRQAERAALPLDDLRKALDTLDRASLKGKRDAAMLLLGFTGAMRRSEIVAIDFEDVTFVEEGITIELRRSKIDQTGEGVTIPIPYGSTKATCPVRALKHWIETAKIGSGSAEVNPPGVNPTQGNALGVTPLFRSVNRHGDMGARLSDQSVGDVVKSAAKAAGLDEKRLSAHSLRAGCATQAAKKGISSHDIKRLGRWKSNTFERYIRFATVWEDAPATRLGL